MHLRVTVPTSWMLGWSFFGLKTGLLFGPWCVLNVMLLQCRTRREEIKSLYPTDPEPPEPASAPISALFLSEVAEHFPSTLRKMPWLSEPGPLGMRAEHWYDFGSLAGNSDLFVQVVAHIAAAAVPNSVLQYLRAGQITPLAKPTGGHRPLLMMSFLRRLALKSVMAAKKESVAKCAGPFQYGVGYLAEADNPRVLVALDQLQW